jgi:hypothetical protein
MTTEERAFKTHSFFFFFFFFFFFSLFLSPSLSLSSQ